MLYEWQKECLELIKDKNAIISAPTNAGKTKVAYIWMDVKSAIEGGHKIIYTVPIKALANEKCDELVRIYGKDYVGIETGDIKKRENSPILVCTQEIYTRKYAKMKMSMRVIMDEFHYIFSAKDRARAYVDGIRYANDSHKILIMSATLGNAKRVQEYLLRATGKEFVLYETDFRPTRLEWTQKTFSLENLPPYSLVYMFHTRTIDNVCKYMTSIRPPLPILKRRKIKLLADQYGINLERFPEVLHGIAKYHSKLTYTEKRWVERLIKEGYISVVFATNALGVGVNLPFEYVVFGHLAVPNGDGYIPLTKTDFLQLSGRAGRKGYFEVGYVALLEHGYSVYETKKEREEFYKELLQKPIEEPSVVLTPNLENIVKGISTIDKEIDYIRRFSLPEIQESELEETYSQLKEVEEALKNLSELELKALRRFYMPELTFKENLKLAELLSKRKPKAYQNQRLILINPADLRFIRDSDEVRELLKKRKVLLTLHDKTFNRARIYCEGIEEITKEIKAKDPLLMQVGEGGEI